MAASCTYHLPTPQQDSEPYKKPISSRKILEIFWKTSGEGIIIRKNKKTERAGGLGGKTKEEIRKGTKDSHEIPESRET